MLLEPLVGPEPLDSRHELEDCDCGASALEAHLKKRALTDQRAEKSRTYVAALARRVVAYFSLAAASIESEHAPIIEYGTRIRRDGPATVNLGDVRAAA